VRPTEDRIDLAASVPEPFEGDLRLEPCQRRAQAEVDALAEGGMRARLPSHVEAVGVRERSLVAIRGTDQQSEPHIGGNPRPANLNSASRLNRD